MCKTVSVPHYSIVFCDDVAEVQLEPQSFQQKKKVSVLDGPKLPLAEMISLTLLGSGLGLHWSARAHFKSVLASRVPR